MIVDIIKRIYEMLHFIREIVVLTEAFINVSTSYSL